MLADDEMTLTERRKYLKKMWPRYLQADRGGRSYLLTEMEQITGMHRKSLIRLLKSGSLERRQRTTARRRSYGLDGEQVVHLVWESLDYVCAERLTPTLLPTAASRHIWRTAPYRTARSSTGYDQPCYRAAHAQEPAPFYSTSASKRTGAGQPPPPSGRHGTSVLGNCDTRLLRSGPRPAWWSNELWRVCAYPADGRYRPGWSERVAVFGRSQRAMEAGFRRILARLPFPVRQLHPDNGAAFFNHHLVRVWGETITGLTLSRSRPYHKNDPLVRAYLGPLRLDMPQHAAALDAHYDQMWLSYNCYQPVLHLTQKLVVDGNLKRTWDTAAPPDQRLVGTGILDKERQGHLDYLYSQTNPRQLRNQIYRQVDKLAARSVPRAQVAA